MTEAFPPPNEAPLDDETQFTAAEILNRQNARELIGRILAEADVDNLVWRSSSQQEAIDANRGLQFARIEGEDTFITAVRDASNPTGPYAYFTREEIAAVLDGTKNQEFDDLI